MDDQGTPRTKVDLDAVDDFGFQRLGDELGLESFGLNVVTLRPGQRNRVHIHEHQDEVYLVLEGQLTIVFFDDAEISVERHEVVRIAPEVRRQLVNRGRHRVVLLAIGGFGKHERWDALAWTTWDEPGDGRHPKEVPLPSDLPSFDEPT